MRLNRSRTPDLRPPASAGPTRASIRRAWRQLATVTLVALALAPITLHAQSRIPVGERRLGAHDQLHRADRSRP